MRKIPPSQQQNKTNKNQALQNFKDSDLCYSLLSVIIKHDEAIIFAKESTYAFEHYTNGQSQKAMCT